MTAHEYDKRKHFGIHVPDDPTEAEVVDLLRHLRTAFRLDQKVANQAEVDRTRGTPGEAVPNIEMSMGVHIVWYDTPDVTMRVLRDQSTAYFYKGPTLDFFQHLT